MLISNNCNLFRMKPSYHNTQQYAGALPQMEMLKKKILSEFVRKQLKMNKIFKNKQIFMKFQS